MRLVLRRPSMDHLSLEPASTKPGIEGPERAFSARYDDTPQFLDRSDSPTTTNNPNPVLADCRSFFHGWRAGAFCSGLLAVVSLLINLSLAIWIGKHSSSNNGLYEVITESCPRVRSIGIGLHFAINAVSTILLGGSNYCMQCLCAPTRREVDKAHSTGTFLDIGIVSIRNLFSISRCRNFMWWMLALSSLPLHFLYNSTFYDTVGNNDYDIFVANETYFASGAYLTTNEADTLVSSVAVIEIVQNGSVGNFHRLQTADCIREYARPVLTERRNLVLLTSNATSQDIHGLSFLHAYNTHAFDGSASYFAWMCESDPWLDTKITEFPSWALCINKVGQLEEVADKWTPYNYTVQYCLSEEVPSKCTLNGNFHIIMVVIICNVIKAIVMLFVAFGLEDDLLITIGDAIQSFLDKPDPTTTGCCWMGRSDFLKKGWLHEGAIRNRRPQPTKYLTEPPAANMSQNMERWWNAAGTTRWFGTMIFFVFVVLCGLGFFAMSMSTIQQNGGTVQGLGFGRLDLNAIIEAPWIDGVRSSLLKVQAAILIANAPQVVLSLLYCAVNGVFTKTWLAAEWTDFVGKRQYLRVSIPKGDLRSTHFLHLPYHVSLLLFLVSTFFHWLLSQSLFLVVVTTYSSTGYQVDFSASCGFSPMAIILTTTLGCATLVAFIFLGFRPLQSGIPFAGSCSAAISAACHPPKWDDKASLREIQYGAVPDSSVEGTIGHCSFSSEEVQESMAGKLYAGLYVAK